MTRYYKGFTIACALLLILTAIVLLLVHSKPSVHAPDSQTASLPRYWIITSQALNRVTADPDARAAISKDVIYSPGYNPTKATPSERGLFIIPAETFQSDAQFVADVTANNIPTFVKAILYDNEPWQLTPDVEKQNPVLYYKQAFLLAHQYGYYLIAAPVPNSLTPKIAPYADVIDVQAQYAQRSTSTYLKAIKTITQRIVRANPRVIVTSGISTNPPSGDPTPQQLLNITRATYPGLVRGWWLNIPRQGVACPTCQQPRPDTAIKFLKLLGST